MRHLAPLALVAALLAGCGSDIDQGFVTGKRHEPEWTETRWNETCLAYDKNGLCRNKVRTPQYIPHPEQWRLDLRDGELTGYVYVPPQTWDHYQVGDFFPEPR